MNPLMMVDDDGGYVIQRSIRTRASASAYLSRTPATTGNQKTFTISTWLKRGTITSGNVGIAVAGTGASEQNRFMFVNDTLWFDRVTGGSVAWNLQTTQVFRDPSAGYHIILAVDTTQATAVNRVKIYVNGVLITAFTTANYPAQNDSTYYNFTTNQRIGLGDLTPLYYFDGYLAEINFIDGQALTPSSFGEFDPVITTWWKPKKYTGTYGTNGFYLPFTDNSALTTSSNVGLGKDFSGNGNYWTTNNISITPGTTYDSMTDVPTLTSATASNFAVLNPLTSDGTVSNANLTIDWASGGSSSKPATIGVNSGKWYCEINLVSAATNAILVGIIPASMIPSASYPGSASGGYGYFGDGQKYFNGTGSAYGAGINVGDTVGIAFDANNGKLWFARNGVWQASGDPAAGTNAAFTSIAAGTWFLSAGHSGNCTLSTNFGQRPFTYTPPSGFVALNTYNLPDSTIKQGNKVMDATLWTGNGSTQTITNAAGFKPDLVWYKCRTVAYDNSLFDSVRGASNQLSSNLTQAETSLSGVTSFNSNGFALGSSINGNNNTSLYVGWQWQAGQGVTNTNTNGTITSTTSVNAAAGFSVVTYSGNATAGATVGHGLNVAPSFIYTITRAPAGNVQQVYHASIGGTGALFMNSTQATNTASAWWNNTAPTSSVFSLGSGSYANGSGSTMVAYCWAEIPGFSKFGSYTGNGSTDGTFVYLGFRPKFLLIKSLSGARNWRIVDTARNPYNFVNQELYPNLVDVESTTYMNLDILSNGFKPRGTDAGFNGSGETYIYAAFAENPFKYSLAR